MGVFRACEREPGRGVKIAGTEFLKAHPDRWIAQQGRRMPVVNVHGVEVGAPPQRVFEVIASAPQHIQPVWYLRALFGVRWAVGKVLRWDAGLSRGSAQGFSVGSDYRFFRIEEIDAPPPGTMGLHELGLSLENKLTRALLAYVVEPHGDGSRFYDVTCATFKGATGRAYWRLIEFFHDRISEDMLRRIRRASERKS